MIDRQEAYKLVPQSTGAIKVHAANGSNAQIIAALKKLAPLAKTQTKQLAKSFRGASNLETARNIWNFLRSQITYEKDGETQLIRTPSYFLSSGAGDCKSYALFTMGVLQNLEIKASYKFTAYSPGAKMPSHVYVQLADGTAIDGTWPQFNIEKKPSYMRIESINGIGCNNCQNSINGKAQRQARRAERKEARADKAAAKGNKARENRLNKRADQLKKGVQTKAGQKLKKAVKVAKKVVPVMVAARNAYLLLIDLNVRGWATALSKQKTRAFEKWKSLGGNPTALGRAIDKGSRKKPLLGAKAGISEPGTVAAALVAAAPIIAAMAPIVAVAVQALSANKPKSEAEKALQSEISKNRDTTKLEEVASDVAQAAAKAWGNFMDSNNSSDLPPAYGGQPTTNQEGGALQSDYSGGNDNTALLLLGAAALFLIK